MKKKKSYPVRYYKNRELEEFFKLDKKEIKKRNKRV